MDSSLAERVQQMLIQIVPFFMAIVFHEFGHGFVAKLWGDTTATDQGRLTLNPGAHVDPIGTIALPVLNMVTGFPLFIGWAKPVPINPTRFRKYRPGLFCVAVAGPTTNFLIGLLSAFAFGAFVKWVPESFSLFEPMYKMMIAGIQINFALGLFNLIPLPPLDGSKILESFMSYEATRKFELIERYSFIILIGLLWSGFFNLLSAPIMGMTHFALDLTQTLFGLSFT